MSFGVPVSVADALKLDVATLLDFQALNGKASPLAALGGINNGDQTLAGLGGQPAVVLKYDAAFNNTSVAVGGLSTAKRYRILLQMNDNGATNIVQMQPNGSTANCRSRWWVYDGSANIAYMGSPLYVASHNAGDYPLIFEITLSPRRGGLVKVQSQGYTGVNADPTNNTIIAMDGGTSTDFTSLVFAISAAASTGWLTVFEETVDGSGAAGYDPTNGFFLTDVPNNFDPTVFGLAGRKGAMVGTVDHKTGAWVHGTPIVDAVTPDTNWLPLQ